ncbi:hypothetical protein [uncultured Brevibacillus sp.]|uniref:hypothetical protein n=1 Tax=uncultured Brevibacillus sp. TaxID=169970 RepID=UPI002599C803|nr:hypothetical protein [uncultured Brevibacillus sp.]
MTIIRTIPLKLLFALLVTFLFPIFFSFFPLNFKDFKKAYLFYLFYGGIIIFTYGILVSILAESIQLLVKKINTILSLIIKSLLYIIGGLYGGGLEGGIIAFIFFALEAIHPIWYKTSPNSFVLFSVLLPILSIIYGLIVSVSSI